MKTLPWRIVVLLVTVVVLAVLSSTLYTVSEGQEALIVRLGAPVGVESQPGLKFKLPMVDNLVFYDARLLTLESPAEQVILGDQKRVVLQAYARYRIKDVLRFNQAVRTLQLAEPQLAQVMSTALRRVLGQVSLLDLLSPKRVAIIQRIQDDVVDKTRGLGIEVVEVRLHRADLPLETSQAIYDRMKSEREREAKELRAQGFEWAQEIQAKAEAERTVILSEAQRQSRITRGEGDAAAGEILNNAFGQDARFYQFYRSLQTYRQALADTGATLVLSPDTAFLQPFKSGPGAGMTGGPAHR
ncbi:protease modulator HflC [Ideonella sp. B508-1]|uniref:protease modulator HflC n=1 Tax=Ideonella sp. B508-1 TaxID=137716 RepID=UPI000349C615|nr:protease modulator HflC [Ideonella sp. B508-1]